MLLQVGLVSQEPTLFATSIYENIAQGKPGAGYALWVSAVADYGQHDWRSAAGMLTMQTYNVLLLRPT